MLDAPDDLVRAALDQLIEVGMWRPLDAARVDTVMGGQLPARVVAREAKSRAGSPAAHGPGGCRGRFRCARRSVCFVTARQHLRS